MGKRQQRINRLKKFEDKNSLVGEEASFCMNDKRVIFGTIKRFEDDSIVLQDKLLKNHAFSLEEITEIIVEKADNL